MGELSGVRLFGNSKYGALSFILSMMTNPYRYFLIPESVLFAITFCTLLSTFGLDNLLFFAIGADVFGVDFVSFAIRNSFSMLRFKL